MDPKMSFRQQDITDLDVIPGDDLNVLLQVVQRLIDEKYFRTVNAPDGVAWMLRTAEDAKRYVSLHYRRQNRKLPSSFQWGI